jgi:ribosomal protein L11 methyltransferase
MSSLDYVELIITLEPLEPWREILMAELADIGFDSFEETTNGLKAFGNVESFDIELTGKVLESVKKSGNLRVVAEHKIIGSQNWNQVWESNFEPVVLANACYVRAPFHPQGQGYELELIIEPKMSFGTGHHETTALMAEWLFDTDMHVKSTLDMGCGTGLLAMIAAHRGAKPVFAIDNYIFAYENTLENVERNNLPWIRVLHGDAGNLGNEKFDIIIANITKNVLLKDMETYVSVLNTGGIVFLSGFLKKDRKDIVHCAEKLGLSFAGEKSKNDWQALKFVR